jgi:hypothetical protein
MLSSTQRNGWLPVASRSAGLLLLVTVAFLASGCVQVQAADGGFVMGGDIHVEKGETARDDVVAIGGNVRIDGRARRDVVVVGGRLEINGEVDRSVSCVGGTLVLGPGARIGGDAVVVGGFLDRHDSARIDGEFVNVSIGTGFWNIGWHPWSWGGWWGFTPFAMFWHTTQLFYWLLLALLTVALVGDRVSSACHAITREPLRLGAIGLVGVFALSFAFVVLVILSFLSIGIPFLLALIFACWLAYIFGLVAVFQAVGNRVMNMAGRPEASQIAIVLAGGLVMGIVRYVPVIGGVIWFVAALVGFGSVFATRFGTGRPWVHRSAAASAPVPGSAGPPGDYAPSGTAPAAPPDEMGSDEPLSGEPEESHDSGSEGDTFAETSDEDER